MSSFTLQEISAWVNGEIIGDASVPICDALPLQDVTNACITLADHARQSPVLEQSVAAAAVVPPGFPCSAKSLLVVPHPHTAFELIISRLRPEATDTFTGIHPSAIVHDSAQIGAGTVIQPGAIVAQGVVIGKNCTIYSGVNIMARCRLGDDCVLFPGAVLYPATILDDRVLIHAAAVLGAYGFGYRQVDGQHCRTAQRGWVHLESDVEIGAGTTVDRGTFGATRIGTGTKIDNQVQIGHNCRIGRHNLICAQVGIAGSTTTGDYVVMAGQVGVKDHLRIADRVVIAAQSGVMQDIAEGEKMLGTPAMPHKHAMQQVAAIMRLPELRKQIRIIQQQMDGLLKDAESNADDTDADTDTVATDSTIPHERKAA
jgi:UDP-3-O-[3-hydroxymyristoyl] glucosamine N-acyltransferase